MFRPSGVNAALVTPFDEKGVDEEKYRKLIRYVIGQGVDGLVPCGSTGEFSNMTFEEKGRAIQICIEEARGKASVIAGAGDAGTDATLRAVLQAQNLGADAVLVVTPYYMKPGDKGCFEHFATLSENSDIPIILYNIPQLTGVTLSWKVVEDLVELKNIVGIKDSSGNMSYVMTLLEKVSERISVLCGWDEIVFPAFTSGADGCILQSANVIADYWKEIYNNTKAGKWEEAKKTQRKIQKFVRLLCASGALGTKVALNYCGIDVGLTRKPIMLGDVLSYENREEIRIELEKLGKCKMKILSAEEERHGIEKSGLLVGEALAGEGNEVAHIDIVIGTKEVLGQVYASALANPREGHEPLQAILEPNILVKPETLIVPTVKITSMRQAGIIYGPAQAGVGKAVADCLKDGFVSEDKMIIANVFVHPAADKRKQVYVNNYKAMVHAIRRAVEGRPTKEEIVENAQNARHPFRYDP